jgi:Flp pilus assembly protein TadG
LAIDVSGALSARRFYRSAADAAALAGAQDLQIGTTRAVSNTERTNARTDAMARLVSLMGATSTPGATGNCDPANQVTQISDCALPGTPYLVSIKTPSPSCVACSPNRSVQVTVRNPTYGLTFSRLFGQASWNVASTSVAGLTYSKSYTIVTLRPPKQLGNPENFDVRDITLDGNNTKVRVMIGDVGSNSNMNYSGTGAELILNPDYDMWYFDPNNGPLWSNPPSPPGQKLSSLISDPNYVAPSMSGAPVWDDARESQANVAGKPVTTADVDSTCRDEWNKVDPTRYVLVASTPLNRVYCYQPGIYDPATSRGSENARLTISTGNVGLLRNSFGGSPRGAYYLKAGVDVGGSLLGGYDGGQPGVALMLDECGNVACNFKGNNAFVLALNAGTRFPGDYAGGSPATAARDWAGALVQTSGAASPTPPLPITLYVIKDPNCYVPTTAPFIEPNGCREQDNQTIFAAGSAALVLDGVQYLPTDNATFSGSSSTTGRIGQVIAWTLEYKGGTTLNETGADNGGPGILRLDAACTAPSTVCNSP